MAVFNHRLFVGTWNPVTGGEVWEKGRFDVILMDVQMPEMDGIEATAEIRKREAGGKRHTPIIAITAETHRNVKEMVLAAGCDGYIPKPINVSEFIFKIEEFLSGHKEEMEPEEERIYLQKYNIQLVNRLKKKISELEKLNENLSGLNSELFSSKEELARYNDRLFYLNNLANYLRALDDPQALIEILPAKVVEGFQVKRCVLFEISDESSSLIPLASAGIALSSLKKQELQLSENFYRQLSEQNGTIWIKNLLEIVDLSLYTFSEKLESLNFLISNLSNLGRHRDSTSLLKKVNSEPDQDVKIEFSKKYLIFMDKGKEFESFHTYEVRIIKSFLHSVAIIYENMLLHSRLIDSYKIKAEQAIRDGMTKVYNYRFFIQELQRETNRSIRFKTYFSLMIIDIDHFKKYNDTCGHIEGDKVLKLISRLMDQNTRSTDTVCRYGGEEFTIIMPGLKKAEAIVIAEKLRSLIEGYHFKGESAKTCCKVTISIGVSSYPEDETEPEKLLQLADKALYRAKEDGRNLVVAN